MSAALVVLVPLRIEARAVRRGAPGIEVVVTGMGPRRSQAAAAALARRGEAGAVAVMGVCGGMRDDMAAGDLVVADEVRGAGAAVGLRSAHVLADALRRRGEAVHVGPVASVPRPVRGRRRALAATGAVAVDMESAWLAPAAQDRPLVVVRAVVDTPGRPLGGPGTAVDGVRALRSLRHAAAVLEEWATAVGCAPAPDIAREVS